MVSKDSNAALCLAGLRALDMDRYLAVLLSPENARPSLAALYAYNAELARVRDLVRDPLPGEIRLQYWRDLLEGSAHGSTEANPIAAELLGAVEAHRLPRTALAAMSEARIFDLYDDPMESVAAFEGYAGETTSSLIQLASLVLDPQAAGTNAQMAGHAGVAQAVAGTLLLLPGQIARGQLYIPAEILGAVGLDRTSFLEGGDTARIDACIEAFAGFGLDHLARALPDGQKVPETLAAAYLPVALARPVLSAAARKGRRAIEGTLRPAQWRRQFTMMMSMWRRRF